MALQTLSLVTLQGVVYEGAIPFCSDLWVGVNCRMSCCDVSLWQFDGSVRSQREHVRRMVKSSGNLTSNQTAISDNTRVTHWRHQSTVTDPPASCPSNRPLVPIAGPVDRSYVTGYIIFIIISTATGGHATCVGNLQAWLYMFCWKFRTHSSGNFFVEHRLTFRKFICRETKLPRSLARA